MDHVVHINNGSGAAKPIVLRLLPGEETIFNLKVVNHGEPSNISLQASSPVLKAVRLKKPDHYVVLEEIIPILARMPANKKRLEGEILLSGSSGESRVPITLLRDSEDPGDDLEDPDLQGNEELKDDLMGEALEREEASDEEEDEDADLVAQRMDGGDREDADNEEVEKEPRRIAFSRDRDLQRYRSATRQQRVAGATESREEKRGRERTGSRIDDRFIDPISRQDESPRIIPRQEPVHEHEVRQRPDASDYDESYQDFRQDQGGESQEIITSAKREERERERVPEEREEYIEPDEGPLPSALFDKLGDLRSPGALKVVPAALFLALVIVLVLTFITQSIPEFPGALASSILIVTLIIYGAATLLKT
ncbi:MAG: hypothetical protein NTU95_08965 [Methanothrix sp.]|nr:hypothetical protein [Methanothrix sp.]